MTESSFTDEDRYSDSASHPEKTKLSTDLNKPVVSDLHISVTQSQIKNKSSVNQNEPMEVTSTQNITSSQNQYCNVVESTKGTHEKHTNSESSSTKFMVPKTPIQTKSDLDIQTRLSNSSESGVPIKVQGFLHDRKTIHPRRVQATQCNIRALQREHHFQEEPDELSEILRRRREKIDS